jgi:hypothetical protein
MPPIIISDRQYLTIANAAAALCPADRDQFMAAVARELAGREIGDGAVGRAVASAFQALWSPPDISRARDVSKYR